MVKNYLMLFPVFFLVTIILFVGYASAQSLDEPSQMFTNAYDSFLKGEYKDAIKIYDKILETDSKNYKILEMKGLA